MTGTTSQAANIGRRHGTAGKGRVRLSRSGFLWTVLLMIGGGTIATVLITVELSSSPRFFVPPNEDGNHQYHDRLAEFRNDHHHHHRHQRDGLPPPSSDSGNVDVVVRCRYHGNCPVHTACEHGLCLPYLGEDDGGANDGTSGGDNNTAQQIRQSLCVDACLDELRADEWYLHEMEPKAIRSHVVAPNNGHGCVIRYRRVRPAEGTEPPRTIEEWMQGRLRRVVRVDPAPTTTAAAVGGQQQHPLLPAWAASREWVALCDHPCKSNSDCPAAGDGDNTICTGRPKQDNVSPIIPNSPLSCRQKPASEGGTMQQEQQQPRKPADMVVVSGADSSYFGGLKNLAASVKFWAPQRKIVIYNLGMTEAQLDEIKGWSNLKALRWPEGIPQSLPPHVNMLKNYAFKPIAINETVHDYGSILWLDAGSTLTGPADPVEDILRWNGIFLAKGQDNSMTPMSHPDTYQWFGYNNKDDFRMGLQSPHFSGNFQAHLYPSRYIDSIVIPNAKCALDSACIEPPGSSLSNHRYDQTTLSILAYQEAVGHYTEYLAADRQQLNDDLSKPSHRMIVWSARQGCTHYSSMEGILL